MALFPPRLHKASTERANAYKCFAEDYQTEHRRRAFSARLLLVEFNYFATALESVLPYLIQEQGGHGQAGDLTGVYKDIKVTRIIGQLWIDRGTAEQR
ncbi:hypothetical protein PROFUN_13322 [Planoprotostelium fungivorum]|uniref:Uncharacterized protein n=1 Tax=Planoprotostelium fungivorum TaxID=1890364 RepID=A0A2P6N458_9EUKA|nr:hypothetical protein PROFUN_13322 [Planoprotostelium fungivorum]